jgi:hypothetical protein
MTIGRKSASGQRSDFCAAPLGGRLTSAAFNAIPQAGDVSRRFGPYKNVSRETFW